MRHSAKQDNAAHNPQYGHAKKQTLKQPMKQAIK
jgi:hypothetical protein